MQTWQSGSYPQLSRELLRLEMDAAFVCAASGLILALTGACAIVMAALGAQIGAYLYHC